MLNKLKIWGFSENVGLLHIFGEVFVDLVPEGCPNPLGFGFGLMGPSL